MVLDLVEFDPAVELDPMELEPCGGYSAELDIFELV